MLTCQLYKLIQIPALKGFPFGNHKPIKKNRGYPLFCGSCLVVLFHVVMHFWVSSLDKIDFISVQKRYLSGNKIIFKWNLFGYSIRSHGKKEVSSAYQYPDYPKKVSYYHTTILFLCLLPTSVSILRAASKYWTQCCDFFEGMETALRWTQPTWWVWDRAWGTWLCVWLKRPYLYILWEFSSGTGLFLSFAVKIAAFWHKCFQSLQPVDVCPPEVAEIRAMTKLWECAPCCCSQYLQPSWRRSTQLWSHISV